MDITTKEVLMKATGITRKVDPLGRIVIPKELRMILDMDRGEPLEIFTEGNSIILRRFKPYCVLCGSPNETREFKEKIICKDCISFIKKTGQ